MYGDSIRLDSLTLSVSLRAFNRAVARPNKLDGVEKEDQEWSSDIKGRYQDLTRLTNQFERKYSDVPGMLLKVARAQLESGQCDEAQVIFEAVYHHRHAVFIERLFAGLYLRAINHQPDDFSGLLARFDPSDDLRFLRALIASPGVAIGIFQVDLATISNNLLTLQKYAEQLLLKPPGWHCDSGKGPQAFVERGRPTLDRSPQKRSLPMARLLNTKS